MSSDFGLFTFSFSLFLYNGLYGEAPPGRGNFFKLQAYERVQGFHLLKYTEG